MPTHPLRFIRHFALLAGTLLAFGCFAEPAQPAQTVLAERIDLIRHGESEDNLNEGKTVVRLDGTLMPSKGKVLSGWNSASLTMRGVSQAVKAGEVLLKQEKEAEKNAGDTAGAASPKLRDALWLYSPLLRTKQTLSGVLLGAQLDNEKALKLRPDTRIFERSAGSRTALAGNGQRTPSHRLPSSGRRLSERRIPGTRLPPRFGGHRRSLDAGTPHYRHLA